MTAFVRLFDFVRSIYLVTGGNVLLPHFLRRVFYKWLYSLWKSVMYLLLPHSLRRVLYRWLYSLWKSVNVMSDITTFVFANC